MKRAEIVEALKKAGIKYSATMTNVDLELLLKAAGNAAPTTTPPAPPAEPPKKTGDGYEATMLTAVWYNKVLYKKGERVTLDEGAYELFKKEKFIAA